MRRFTLLVLLLALMLLPCLPAAAESVSRALLISCDYFVAQEDTYPSCWNNVTGMTDILSGGSMNLAALVTRRGDIASVSQLERAVTDVFGSADEDDVSYFYISTHGVWNDLTDNGSMALVLSDGESESTVTARMLRHIFDQVRGTKVLFVDACHSGAIIGRGVQDSFENVFASPDYKVICSSGGMEQSWFWSGTELNAGAGYFSGALIRGLGIQGAYGADSNQDGEITLREIGRYLRDHHGASTPHIYPENDDFVVIRYDPAEAAGIRRNAEIINLVYSGDAMTDELSLDFSFTMLHTGRVAYQLVYRDGARWDFDNATFLWDTSEDGDPEGTLSPGYKTRTISIDREEADGSGYVLLQMLSMTGSSPEVISGHVICVARPEGDPQLQILMPESFCPSLYQQCAIVVFHEDPCEITLWIEDSEGKRVCWIAADEASRPEHLRRSGSTFVWDGKLSNGETAPVGTYTAHARVTIGSETYEAVSDPVLLATPVG